MFSSDDKSVGENIMDFLFKGENSFALFTSNICSDIMNEKGIGRDLLSAQ